MGRHACEKVVGLRMAEENEGKVGSFSGKGAASVICSTLSPPMWSHNVERVVMSEKIHSDKEHLFPTHEAID